MINTFRYILTLADVKKAYPDSSWVRITTVTMIAKFERDVDLRAFREKFRPLKIRPKGSSFGGFEWNIKKTTFYNQVTIFTRDLYSNKSIKLFPNGSVQVAGCSDLLDCERIAKEVEFIVGHILPTEVPNRLLADTISVKMINTNFSLNTSVNLTRVIQAFGRARIPGKDPDDAPGSFLVTFDPDRYSAVKVKFCPVPGMKRVTASIFSTGKIIVTGAQTLREIALAYKTINEIMAHPEVRLGTSDKKDSFDTILGHKFSEWIPKLQEKGFTAWRS